MRALIAGMETGPVKPFPMYLRGLVAKGFGRGSKELGFPTANLPSEVSESAEGLVTGIYFGYASVDSGVVHPMVMSYGWNPFYKNEKRTAEVHILHLFNEDFYNEDLKIVILGYIRDELDYTTKEALIEDILIDIKVTQTSLDRPVYQGYKDTLNEYWK